MARPKSGRPQAVHFAFRVPPAERSEFEAIAAERGVTPSELARESVRRTIAEHRSPEQVAS